MGKISSFITGAAIGAVAALLLAPRTGQEARTLIVEKANAVASEAKDLGASIPASAKEVVDSVRKDGAAALKDIPSKVQGVGGNGAAAEGAPKGSAADSDELREKIEAARQRIAAQVMENAEQSKAVDVAAAEA
jgi:gas vesicle protein